MKGKSTYPITAFLFAVVLCAVSCLQEEILEPQQNKAAFTIVGNPVEVHLGITVNGLSVGAGTRAEEPTANADVEDTEAERHVDDLWLFEYSSSTKELIYPPTYLTISEQEELADIKMTLSDNNGDPVTVYVVANSGSGYEENSKNWVVEETTGDGISYTGFMTIDELEANSLPTPYPQRMIWDGEKYVIQYYDGDIIGNISIPMSGHVGDGGDVTVKKDADILVPVDRMFAKLLIAVDLSEFDDKYDQSADLYALSIGNIPEYCRVGTLWDGDTYNTAQPADYSECKQWISRRFTGDGMAADFESDEEPDYPYNYIIYIPENIQGENSNADASGKADNAPISEGSTSTRALSTEVSVNVTLEDGSVVGPYTYTAYPGGNSKTNFNIRRNCVYRMKLKVDYPIALNAVPSANCIVCLSGQTTAFFPYCREETGGGYKFSDYLNAYDESGKKKIGHVGIIWQSTNGGNTVDYSDEATGFIGDNTNGKLVWIDDAETVGEYNRKIYVKIPEGSTGNALIGAYNSDDEIIWSWHIWSRTPDTDPTSVNTKLYYTYEWDSNGIYGRDSGVPRVMGYTIMNCNLGAMQDEPAGSIYAESGTGGGAEGFKNARPTFGTLYQWGRKDPFPPVTAHLAVGNYGGPSSSADTTVLREYRSDIIGNYFDNSNTAVSIVGTNDPAALFHSVEGTGRQEFDTMIPLTIQNPTVFYAGTKEINKRSVNYIGGTDTKSTNETSLQTNYPEPCDGNWMLDGDGDHFNSLWGGLDPEKDMAQITKSYDTGYSSILGDIHMYDDYGEKSIFDPCPAGWRVSPPDMWSGFTDTGLNPAYSNVNDMSHVNYVLDEDKSNFSGMTMYLTAWQTGETSFFPIQGTRSPDGCGFRVGQCGNYNNATSDSGGKVNTLHIHYHGSLFLLFEYTRVPYFVKSSAGPVRCARVSSVQQ